MCKRSRIFSIVIVLTYVSFASAVESPQNVDEILEHWERACSEIESYSVEFKRYRYDKVFEVETRAEGRFYFLAPKNGRLDISPAKISEDAVSAKKGREGESYRLNRERPETWIWRDGNVLQIDEVDKGYVVIPRTNEHFKSLQFFSILLQPQRFLPFVVDVNADDLKQRFDFTSLKQTDEQIWLKVEPRTAPDSFSFQWCRIILDAQTYRIHAVKFVDSNGNTESVYVFGEPKINEPQVDAEEPLQPNLEGYRGGRLEVDKWSKWLKQTVAVGRRGAGPK